MKKEFKAPIVETKVLHTVSNVMLDLSKSGEFGTKSNNLLDDKVTEGYTQWKGFNK